MTKKISSGEIFAEFLGSMFLVMASISSIIMFVYVLEAPKGVAILANAIAVGFVLCALIEIFGRVSGAHFNPAVTVIMALDKKIGTAKALLYIPVQIAGGIAGAMFSHLMFYGQKGFLLAVSDNIRNEYVFFGEIAGSFILILAILLLVKAKSEKISIVLGFLVGGQLMSTSSTMFANPQVTIARMFTDSASGIRPIDGLLFIVMQFIGAFLAYGVYKFMFTKKDREVQK